MHMHERFVTSRSLAGVILRSLVFPIITVSVLLPSFGFSSLLSVCILLLGAEAELFGAPAEAAEKPATTSGAHSFHSLYSKQDPLSRSALYDDRGLQLGREGHWQESIKQYEKALNEEPDNQSYRVHLSVAHLSYANVLSSKKKNSKAIDEYKRCLYLDAENKQADRRFDECLRQAGKNPLDPTLRLDLAKAADRDGHFDYAIHEYRKAATLSGDGPGYFRLGKELLKLGKKDEARSAFESALGKQWAANQNADKIECQSLLQSLTPQTQTAF